MACIGQGVNCLLTAVLPPDMMESSFAGQTGQGRSPTTPPCLSLLRQLGGLYLRELAGQTVQEGYEIPLLFVCHIKTLQVRILP